MTAPSASVSEEAMIADLPDELVVQILSRLTVNQAQRTSELSHRWRNLWRSTTSLTFDAPRSALRSSDITQYIDKVLKLHECHYLDEFRVICQLSPCDSSKIDDWIINCVIPKRVKTLEINLTVRCDYDCNKNCYKGLRNLSNIHGLTSLTLKGVEITTQVLEGLLSNSPHLELLSLSGSSALLNLKVCGLLHELKQLVVSDCTSLERIELGAPKLAKFSYSGRGTKFGNVPNNPNLSELIIRGERQNQVTCILDSFSQVHSKIKTLKLNFNYSGVRKFPRFRNFVNLKILLLDVDVEYGYNHIGFTSLVEVAPSLKRFTLHLTFHESRNTKPPAPLFRPHKCLKEVEVLGFAGGCPHLGFVKYLLKNAINLEKIVIGPFHPKVIYKQEKADRRRSQIRHLMKLVPPGAKLVVLRFGDLCKFARL